MDDVISSLLPQSGTADERDRQARVAVLPVGSFEQHGPYLPLATDTVIACTIAREIAAAYPVLHLPPVTISCSHEHAAWPGTVSISASTLHAVVRDIAESLRRSGVTRLVLVNGHGGNYVLGNIVQEANVGERRMALFPHRDDWTHARKAGGLVTDNHEDMHGGELETSILLFAAAESVRPGFDDADHVAPERTHLHIVGMSGYTDSGLIGRHSLATADKGRLVLADLSQSFEQHLVAMGD
jgi:creatinine amidohydrolase